MIKVTPFLLFALFGSLPEPLGCKSFVGAERSLRRHMGSRRIGAGLMQCVA
jgi:hypothetical protein